MGVQLASLPGGPLLASKSTDTTPPTSTITSPTGGSTVTSGSQVTITGTATDSGAGVVGGVEVSVDGGTTWHPASGRENWSFIWGPNSSGTVTIESRAVDDSGNLETPGAGVDRTGQGQTEVWGSATTPELVDSGDANSVELGGKFTSSQNGFITGIRLYHSAANTGTHVGNLWTTSGTRLASAVFTGESASGWQQVNFSSPVAITANTTYVASYYAPACNYSFNAQFFGTAAGDNPPLHALANSVTPEGVYTYDSTTACPPSSFHANNYWVDVAFVITGTPAVTTVSPAHAAPVVSTGTSVTATFNE